MINIISSSAPSRLIQTVIFSFELKRLYLKFNIQNAENHVEKYVGICIRL